MSYTKDTLVQPPDDPKELAKQTFIMMQHLFHTVQDMAITIQSMDSRLTSVEAAIENINARLTSLETVVENINTRLTSLEAKVDAQGKEIKEISDKLSLLASEVEAIKEINTTTHKIDRRLSKISLELAEIVIRVDSLEDNLVKR